jgi:hypothetical protein
MVHSSTARLRLYLSPQFIKRYQLPGICARFYETPGTEQAIRLSCAIHAGRKPYGWRGCSHWHRRGCVSRESSDLFPPPQQYRKSQHLSAVYTYQQSDEFTFWPKFSHSAAASLNLKRQRCDAAGHVPGVVV